MQNLSVAFEIHKENGASAPVVGKKVSLHIVFDVRIYFTRKSRWLIDGNRTPNPIGSTYAIVMPI